MRILGLDLGTSTGWAFNTGEQIVFGRWNLQPSRHEDSGMRWLKFRNSLNGLRNAELIVYEEVARHKGAAAAHIYGGLVATLQSWCKENSIRYTSVPVGTVKKYATGKGNAAKETMIQAANSKLGHIVGSPLLSLSDHDIADALWILNWAMQEYK